MTIQSNHICQFNNCKLSFTLETKAIFLHNNNTVPSHFVSFTTVNFPLPWKQKQSFLHNDNTVPSHFVSFPTVNSENNKSHFGRPNLNTNFSLKNLFKNNPLTITSLMGFSSWPSVRKSSKSKFAQKLIQHSEISEVTN